MRVLLVLVAFARIFAETVEDNDDFVKEASLSKKLFDEFYSCLCDGDYQECIMTLSRDGVNLNADEVERFGELENSNNDCKYFTCSIAIRGQTPALVCSQEMNATTVCTSGLESQFIQLETHLCCSSTCVGLFWNNVNDALLFDDPDLGVENCSKECTCPDSYGETTPAPDESPTINPTDDENINITLTAEPSNESALYSSYSTSKTSSDFATVTSSVESTPSISYSTSSIFPAVEDTTSHTSYSSSKSSSNFPRATSTTEKSPQDLNSSLTTTSFPNDAPDNDTTSNKPGSVTSSVTEGYADDLPRVLQFTENTGLNYFIIVVIVVAAVVVGVLVFYTVRRAWKRRTTRNSGDVIDVTELERLKSEDLHV